MKERMPKYLHKPLQILWFDVNEIVMIVIFYMFAMMFGGLAWFLVILGPLILIPFKRKQPRGYIQHVICYLGYSKMIGYPLPVSKRFRE